MKGFALFESAIGHCGIAWDDTVLTGVLLPEGSEAATRRRMRPVRKRNCR